METANCTIIGQKSRGGSTYAATAVYMGYGNGSTHYEYVLSFTTGAFAGKSNSITFNIKMGNSSQGASRTYRWALLNSDSSVVGRDTSENLYFDKHVEVADPNQLAQGTITWSDMNKDTHKALTIETTELKENTNYFLVLWAYSTNPTSFVTVSNTQYHGGITLEFEPKTGSYAYANVDGEAVKCEVYANVAGTAVKCEVYANVAGAAVKC